MELMDTSVVSAIIVAGMSLIGTLAGSWMGVRQSNKLVNWRIDELEKKVMKHNNLVERTAIVERDLQSAHERIDEIRADLHHLMEVEK